MESEYLLLSRAPAGRCLPPPRQPYQQTVVVLGCLPSTRCEPLSASVFAFSIFALLPERRPFQTQSPALQVLRMQETDQAKKLIFLTLDMLATNKGGALNFICHLCLQQG
jgi:hypothetical protein